MQHEKLVAVEQFRSEMVCSTAAQAMHVGLCGVLSFKPQYAFDSEGGRYGCKITKDIAMALFSCQLTRIGCRQARDLS